MLKKIWKFIKSPIQSTREILKDKVIKVAFQSLNTYIQDKLPHPVLQMYLFLILKRLKDIAFLFTDDIPDNKAQLQKYWEDHRLDILREQIQFKQTILSENLNDPELAAIFNDFSSDLKDYIEKRTNEI